jgi:hypothetical protein
MKQAMTSPAAPQPWQGKGPVAKLKATEGLLLVEGSECPVLLTAPAR